MPEICADAALYFDPFDIDELAELMYTLLTDDLLWKEMRRRGLKRAGKFSWASAASRTMSVIEQAVEKSRGRTGK